MHVQSHTDPKAFENLAGPVFLQSEAQNCLGIGILDTLIHRPDRYPRFHLLSVHDGDRVVGAAWMTPPHPLGITAMPTPALAAVVAAVRTLPDPVMSVVGPRPAVDAFKDLWFGRSDAGVRDVMQQRIYQLTAVSPPAGVTGTMRTAGEPDRALLETWSLAFSRDCGLGGTVAGAAEAADFSIKSGNRVFWEAGGGPVSMAGFNGKTPSGIRVNWVYTPAAERGKGYASALVAALSQRLLDEGRSFCFLYTDLANPTSNGIYQKIGYRPVCDSAHFFF